MMEDRKDKMMMTRYEFLIEEIRGEKVIKKRHRARELRMSLSMRCLKSRVVSYVVIVGCCFWLLLLLLGFLGFVMIWLVGVRMVFSMMALLRRCKGPQ